MNTITRWDQSRGAASLQDQVIRSKTTLLATARALPN